MSFKRSSITGNTVCTLGWSWSRRNLNLLALSWFCSSCSACCLCFFSWLSFKLAHILLIHRSNASSRSKGSSLEALNEENLLKEVEKGIERKEIIYCVIKIITNPQPNTEKLSQTISPKVYLTLCTTCCTLTVRVEKALIRQSIKARWVDWK